MGQARGTRAGFATAGARARGSSYALARNGQDKMTVIDASPVGASPLP